jgi:hypothetical protein
VEETTKDTKDTKTKAAMRQMAVERQSPNGDEMGNVSALDSEPGQAAVPFVYFVYFVVPTETSRLRRREEIGRSPEHTSRSVLRSR